MRTSPRQLTAAVAVLLALTGCAGDDPAGDAGPDPSATAAGPEATPSVPPLLGGEDGIDDWPETLVTLDGDDGRLLVAAKVADTSERRQQGLMHVPDLPDGVGMLFLFEEARTGGFWMKNTLVPLDIAYLADGEVAAILQMEPCEADPCPTYDPALAYDAALEVPQGTFEAAGVDVGAGVRWTEPQETTPQEAT